MARVEGFQDWLRNVDRFQGNIEASVVKACDEIAAVLESYAKSHHKWGNPYSKGYVPTGLTDQTTRGTWEQVRRDLYRIVLSAGMEYNVVLELARNGKWSWLAPAVEANQQVIINILSDNLRMR